MIMFGCDLGCQGCKVCFLLSGELFVELGHSLCSLLVVRCEFGLVNSTIAVPIASCKDFRGVVAGEGSALLDSITLKVPALLRNLHGNF